MAFCLIPQFDWWTVWTSFCKLWTSPSKGTGFLGTTASGKSPHPTSRSHWLESSGAQPTEFLIKGMLCTDPLDFHHVFLILVPKDWKSRSRTWHYSSMHWEPCTCCRLKLLMCQPIPTKEASAFLEELVTKEMEQKQLNPRRRLVSVSRTIKCQKNITGLFHESCLKLTFLPASLK